MGDAYADSVFNQAGAVRNTDTVTRQGGGTPGNEPLTLSAEGQTPGYVGLSDDDDDEKKSSEPESPIIPVAGGLFLNTETGEYINNYVDEGNEEESGEVEDPLIEEGNYYIESIQQYYLDKANSSISGDEFNEKYPEGILDEWTVGLGKIIGWEACQDYIDSASQIVKKDEESTDEPYTIYNNPEGTGDETEQDSISPIIPVYGGLFLNTETGEYINNYNDEGNEKAREKAKIKSALQSLLTILDGTNNDDSKGYINELLKEMISGKEFDTSSFFQSTPHQVMYGNEIYSRDFGYDMIAEMEVLNAATVNVYNEQGETLNDITMDLFGLFIPSNQEADSSMGDLINYALEEMVDSIKEQYDPGKILKDGDVRISTQTKEQQERIEYKTNYFFRGSEFLYSINIMTGEILYGESYDKILEERIQEYIDQMS